MDFRNMRLLYGEHYSQLAGLAVLVVGVGGIGCEVLKCFSRLPVRQLDIIDLDTIEVQPEGYADFQLQPTVPIQEGAYRPL
jgi:tRNA A37 threonylcarbamoyladenosine dehydratase